MNALPLALSLLLSAAPDAGTPMPTARPALTPLTSLPYSPTFDLTSLDKSVDPCVDFFRYSCGGWIKANPIPADQSRWGVYAKAHEVNQRLLWGLLDSAAKAAQRTPAQVKVGDAWAACMDETGIDTRGDAPLRAELAQIDALASITELPALFAKASLTGGGTLFDVDADQDFQDAAHYVASAGTGGLGLLDRDQYFPKDAAGKNTLEKYGVYLKTLFGLLGEPDAQALDARR